MFWETSAGEQWLKRLVVAAIYVFGIKRGVGAESLCEFFHNLHIGQHIGVSALDFAGVITTGTLALNEASRKCSPSLAPPPLRCYSTPWLSLN
ncbi:hypothetical protein XM38_025600 [Halomicronema hongdechloris C2206]|uniref:Uncharacterized protein n=1 Tax=Halomicronema hongdechloris C2206 TaxID=1641165 RepID=A0A1Z3HN85_9CYAN|nr:hypothetical protein XM38_025600 [Halomicronema hongdechloris C2206]